MSTLILKRFSKLIGDKVRVFSKSDHLLVAYHSRYYIAIV